MARGHEVQLHIHTEWLEFAQSQPVGDLRGRSIKDFPLAEQTALLGLARDFLCEAGAPDPNAFRAGNYGSNDDTLRALANLGIDWDSSFNPAWLNHGCDISVPKNSISPSRYLDVNIAPISAIEDYGKQLRHAQVCALSASETRSALNHAADQNDPTFVLVSHSFEFLSRDRQRRNPMVMDRFEALCAHIGSHPELISAGFMDLPEPPHFSVSNGSGRLPAHPLRRTWRIGEQALARMMYE